MPYRLLLPLLLLLCLSPPSSANSPQSKNSLQSNTPKCSNVSIPYPFGIIGNYTIGPDPAPGFGITCDKLGPMLPISDNPRVLDISLLHGSVRISGGAIAWQCYNSSNGPNLIANNLSLEGTNFTFSDTRNRFTAVGCDAMVMILNDSSGGQGKGNKYSGGCVSFCPTEDSIIEGTCSGVGCCQAPVPKGLKRLNLEFQSIRKQLTGSAKDDSGENCSKAFIADQESYKFSIHDLDGNPRYQRLPVVLEWSMDGGSCEDAKRSKSYACTENSYCYNSSNGIGYRCNCSQGFSGNPYLPGGCIDIDECVDMNNHPCTHKCINRVGGFNCTCPLGMTGDGSKQGTGCYRDATLDITVGGGLALLVFLLILGFWTYWLVKKRKFAKQKQRYFLQNGGLLLQQKIFTRRAPARIFTSSELENATSNFSEDHIIGRGGYGTVYKGLLSDQTVVAIKKSKLVDQSQMEQFINELVILSQINHKNVVKLLGCCLETEVPLLVYEFISNGALFHHLHNTKLAPISWKHRLRIAVETASALAYLHLATKVPIIHRDVKSANILLDESYTTKVSDFGASRLVPCNQTHVTTLVQGTLGYLDPEYFYTSQLTDKSDVYSFGVVLVELLTREKPISYHRPEEGRNLASYFAMLVQQNRLLEIMDCGVVKEAGVRHVNVVAQLALKCLRPKGEERPRMIEVAIELEALRRLMEQHLALKSEKALRGLMKQHLALTSEEGQLLEEVRCHEEMYIGEPSNLCHNDMTMDKSMESNLLLSMDIPW